MSLRTYNSTVRVGNWQEDVQLDEDTLKDFLEKKETGQLLLQKTNPLSTLTEPVAVSVTCDGMVHFGDRVMLVNKPTNSDRGDCALSLNLTAENLLAADPFSVPPGLSGSPNAKPCNRNLFVVTSPDGLPEGEPLRYNEPFYLCMTTANGKLYLKSDIASFQNSSKKARHNKLTLVDQPSYSAEFFVAYFDPRLRMEFEQIPVPANENVIIYHRKTNVSLAIEAAYNLKTAFGREFEVSCHTYLDSHKAEMDTNRWMFIMNLAGSSHNPDNSLTSWSR